MQNVFQQIFGLGPVGQQQMGQRQQGFNQTRTFMRMLNAKPMSFANKEDTRKVDSGNKVLLPVSALDQLANMNVQYPMMFRVTNTATRRSSHCSVLEFTAPEGEIFMPLSMMHNLGLDVVNHGYVRLENVSLPKGTFAQFQAHKMDFVTDLPDHRIILERTLRDYACLTKGDVIEIRFGGKCYDLDVVELRPANAVSIIETDLNVDFCEPKDHEEYETQKRLAKKEEKPQAQEDSSDDDDDFADVKPRTFVEANESAKSISAPRVGYRLKDGKQVKNESAPVDPNKHEFTTEEEVIGNYRFIYRVNKTTGDREVLRRFPNRGGKAFVGSGNNLR